MSGCPRTLLPVTKRSDRLLHQIEAGALRSKTSVSDLLRKVIELGGEARSAEMRDWAEQELWGYGPGAELPSYRQITAPLQVDTLYMSLQVVEQTISSRALPDFAEYKITEDLNLFMGIAEIEHLTRRRPEVMLGHPGFHDLVALMNASGKYNTHIQRLYWTVSRGALNGVVEHVRTTLTVLVAQINANMPDGTTTLSEDVATNAVRQVQARSS
jgi:hypothetical protein